MEVYIIIIRVYTYIKLQSPKSLSIGWPIYQLSEGGSVK